MLRSAVPEFKPQRGVTFLQMAIPQSYAKSTHKLSQRNTENQHRRCDIRIKN